MKAIFSGALYRHSENDRNVPNNKRTVHRGCHTGTIANLGKLTSVNMLHHLVMFHYLSEDTVMSESTSSMSDSTSHDNGESPRPKLPPHIRLCLWRLSDIFISVMSLTGAVAGRQAGRQRHIQNASLSL